jgi:uncharacterized paraquat-inducible protein A
MTAWSQPSPAPAEPPGRSTVCSLCGSSLTPEQPDRCSVCGLYQTDSTRPNPFQGSALAILIGGVAVVYVVVLLAIAATQ